MKSKRVTIFTGNFGSGKTEISINYSLRLAEEFDDVVLVDLDVINPYFRSREKANLLKENGVEVIFPENLVYADLPIIPASVQKLIQNKDISGVIDVGGDEDGAIALSSISRKLMKEDYEMNLVINTLRQATADLDGIIKVKKRIEERSKLSFDNIICNVNLGRETELDDLKKGYSLIKEAAKALDLPVKFVVIKKELLPLPPDFQVEEEVFPIDIYMNPPWER